jgi:hypothetical protein
MGNSRIGNYQLAITNDQTKQTPIYSSSQVIKGLWWIPRHTAAKKDVVTDEMFRGVGSKQ